MLTELLDWKYRYHA